MCNIIIKIYINKTKNKKNNYQHFPIKVNMNIQNNQFLDEELTDIE